MYGTYDAKNTLSYLIVGGDASLRIGRSNVRLEYLVRRQDFDTSNPASFRYFLRPSRGDFFTKHGAFLEVEHPLMTQLDVIGRVDGMLHQGNVLQTSELREKSSVVRETLGFAYAVERNMRIKASGELWQFSDADGAGRQNELGFHLAAVGTF